MMHDTNHLATAFDDSDFQKVAAFQRTAQTAVLTIMFTDLQDSAALAEQHGDQIANTTRHYHDTLLVPLIVCNGRGEHIKTIGDSLMAVFARPSEAVACALDMQRALATYHRDYPYGIPLWVRIGLHMGEVTVEDAPGRDVFGRHVNRAARVESLAAGGHIYLTSDVRNAALPFMTGHRYLFTDHGEFWVKGVPEPLHIYEVTEDGITKPRSPSLHNTLASNQAVRQTARYVLISEMNLQDGRRIPLHDGKSYVIGRAVGTDISLPKEDELASRIHAQLDIRSSRPIVQDLQSRNGTFVNNERVTKAQLKHGDCLRVGQTVWVVEEVYDPDQTKPADEDESFTDYL